MIDPITIAAIAGAAFGGGLTGYFLRRPQPLVSGTPHHVPVHDVALRRLTRRVEEAEDENELLRELSGLHDIRYAPRGGLLGDHQEWLEYVLAELHTHKTLRSAAVFSVDGLEVARIGDDVHTLASLTNAALTRFDGPDNFRSVEWADDVGNVLAVDSIATRAGVPMLIARWSQGTDIPRTTLARIAYAASGLFTAARDHLEGTDFAGGLGRMPAGTPDVVGRMADAIPLRRFGVFGRRGPILEVGHRFKPSEELAPLLELWRYAAAFGVRREDEGLGVAEYLRVTYATGDARSVYPIVDTKDEMRIALLELPTAAAHPSSRLRGWLRELAWELPALVASVEDVSPESLHTPAPELA